MFRKGYCGRLLAVMGSTILVAGCLGIDDQDPVTVTVSKQRVNAMDRHHSGARGWTHQIIHGLGSVVQFLDDLCQTG